MSDDGTQRRSVRERSKAAFRAAILSAAESVFTREGFSAAKMADIAAEAGVAAGTLYNYFGSKEEIFQSIISSGMTELSEEVETASREPDPIARLRRMTEVMLAFLNARGSLFLIYVQMQGGPDMESLSSAIEHAEIRKWHLGLLTQAATEAQGQQNLRTDIDPQTLVLALTGITHGFITRWAEEGCAPGELARHVDTIFELFLKGCQSP